MITAGAFKSVAIISHMDQQIKIISNWLGSGSINIFGLPFSGKDTQGRDLARLLGGHLIAGGDILRSYPDQNKIKELMSTGDLFPTDFYLSIVLPYLSKSEFKDQPLILSSIGRMHGEEPVVMQAATESGHDIKAVIHLDMSEKDVWERFEAAKNMHDRGDRADDKAEILKNRLREFRDKTVPVIQYYRDKSLLIEVDDTLSQAEVLQEIIEGLYSLAMR